MLILGIETSCDDTAAALVEVARGRFIVRKNLVAAQAKLHAKYKGVVPEVAARAHLETIVPVINEVLAGQNPRTLSAIAVTAGPGLITSLLVGVETAKALSLAWGVPLVGVNHIEGHIYSVLLLHNADTKLRHPELVSGSRFRLPDVHRDRRGRNDKIVFPAIALVVSGGHTELILMTNHGNYKLLGRTRDDAAGETFDKAATMLGLPYPGGPEISKLAERGNPRAFNLPRPMIDRPGFEFSFSGLKNAIRLLVEELAAKNLLPRTPRSRVRGPLYGEKTSTRGLSLPPPPQMRGRGRSRQQTSHDLCASVEQAIVDVLAAKSLAAVAQYHPKTFILAGGVAANKKLRATLASALPRAMRFFLPAPEYCQDNAAMIAAAAYHHIKNKNFAKYDKLKADANWELV